MPRPTIRQYPAMHGLLLIATGEISVETSQEFFDAIRRRMACRPLRALGTGALACGNQGMDMVRFNGWSVRPLGGGLGCLVMILISVVLSVVLTLALNLLVR